MKKCSKCNLEFQDDAMFCDVCGDKLEEKKEIVQDNMVDADAFYCSQCGNQMDKECTFCSQCGTKISYEMNDTSEEYPTEKKFGKKKKVIVGVVTCIIVALLGVGLHEFDLFEKSNPEEEEVEQEVKEFIYLKDDEYYIVDKEGKGVQFTKNYYGKIKEKSKVYYESGEWEYDYEFDFDDVGYTRETLTWNQFWDMLLPYWSSCNASVMACDDEEMLIYEDEIEGEITLYYDEDVEAEYYSYDDTGCNLYCRSMDKLEDEPVLIDTGVAGYKAIGNSCIIYTKYGSEEEITYSLSKMAKVAPEEFVEDISYEKNEIYVKEDENSDIPDKLYVHREDGEELLENALEYFDDTAKDKGICYYVNGNGEFYKYDDKKGKSMIAEDVNWISEGFDSGEIYYAVAEKQKAKMRDFISNDTTNEDLWLMDEECTYNLYHYFYYDGKKSKEIGQSLVAGDIWSRESYEYTFSENDFQKIKQESEKADAFCVLMMTSPQDFPRVLQSELMEQAQLEWIWDMEEEWGEEWSEDWYEESEYSDEFVFHEDWDGIVPIEVAQSEINYAISQNNKKTYMLAIQGNELIELELELETGFSVPFIYINGRGTAYIHKNQKGIIHGSIKDNKVDNSLVYDFVGNESTDVELGFLGNDYYYLIKIYNEDNTEANVNLYVNGEKVDEGSISIIEKQYDSIYYYNKSSGKYICFQDNKKHILADNIDEWIGSEESTVFYKNGNVLYQYDMSDNKEIEIGTDVYDYYLIDEERCFYIKENRDKENRYDLYLVVLDGDDVLIDSTICELEN